MPAEGVAISELLAADPLARDRPGAAGAGNVHRPIRAGGSPAAGWIGGRLIVDLADGLAEPAKATGRVLDPALLHHLLASQLSRVEGYTGGEDGSAAVLHHDGDVMGAGVEGAGRPRG
jgi:hypothetical protein